MKSSAWSTWWQSIFFRMLDKRAPKAVQCELHRKNLYIFPSKIGTAYLALVFLIWLLGTNYQNNLILALVYWQMSLFVVIILETYYNLAGVKVRAMGAKPGFVGEPIEFYLELQANSKAGCDNIVMRWQGGKPKVLALADDAPLKVSLALGSHKRGRLRPQRLLLQSAYPLGLLRCWSWLNLDVEALVYPAPQKGLLPVAVSAGQGDEQKQLRATGDEFAGLKEYRAGDSLKHIAWKHYARGKGLFSKEFEQLGTEQTWLDFDAFFDGDLETTLSRLCYWVLKFDNLGLSYGLRLPGTQIPIGAGNDQRMRALRALATYQE